ncbi:MAG: PilZ domain-containing protein [Brevinematales bacterium]
MPENRKFSRVGFNIACKFKTGSREYSCRVLNLSLKGVLVEIDEDFGEEILKHGIVEISLINSDIVISFESDLVHLNGKQAGFRFVKTDVDSVTHLRSILIANTGNPDKIDDELQFLVDMENKAD